MGYAGCFGHRIEAFCAPHQSAIERRGRDRAGSQARKDRECDPSGRNLLIETEYEQRHCGRGQAEPDDRGQTQEERPTQEPRG